MAKVDIHKSSDEEIADSQLDYYINAGIFKKPEDVDKATMEIGTDRYNSMPADKQKEWFDAVGDKWWNTIAKEWINNQYSEGLINGDMSGDVLQWWNETLKRNVKSWGKIFGITKYYDQIRNSKGRLNDDGIVELMEYLAERKIELNDDELISIKQALKQRRLNGGCGMWKTTGIPYLYKHHRNQLYDFEREWYEKKVGIDK